MTQIKPVRWPPARSADAAPDAPAGTARLAVAPAMWRGMRGLCPNCGKSALFQGFLRPVAACPHCPAPLSRVRAEDMPPYVVIAITGHIIVAAMLLLEHYTQISPLAESLILVPLTVLTALALMRPVKGAIIGLMLALGVFASPPALSS